MPRHPFDEAVTRETLPSDLAERLAVLRAVGERQALLARQRTQTERDRRAARALRLLWARWWRPYEALSAGDRQRAAALAQDSPLVRLLNDPRRGPRLRRAYERVGGPLGWLGVLLEPAVRPILPATQDVVLMLVLLLRWQFVLAYCQPGRHWYARPGRGRPSDACAVHGRPRLGARYLARRRQRREAFRQAHPQAGVWLDQFSRRVKALSAQKRRRGYSEGWYRERVREAAIACADRLRAARDGTPQEWVSFFGARSTLLGRTLADALGLPKRR
jgi:hypothetical protein